VEAGKGFELKDFLFLILKNEGITLSKLEAKSAVCG
jgi:hypothetical protein